MVVLCDDVVGSGGNGAIYEFIIVLVNVAEQVETVVGLTVYGLRMAGEGLNHVMRYHWRGVLNKDFLVLRQDLITYTQTIATSQKVRPNLMYVMAGPG